MQCPKCGTENDDNNFRCTQCNEIIRPMQAHAASPMSSNNPADDPLVRVLVPVGVSGLAMMAGYLGLFSVLLLPAPISLLVGILALRDIKANPKKHGKGRAIFGIVMGALCTLLLVVAIIGMIGSKFS